MDRDAFQRWLDAYIDAWRTYDEGAIRALFSEDATYRYHPWDEGSNVAEGQDAIAAAWLEDRDEPGSWTAEYRAWAVDGDRAVAVGVSRYLAADGSLDREFHNVFVCGFDADGHCREFTDVYMLRKD